MNIFTGNQTQKLNITSYTNIGISDELYSELDNSRKFCMTHILLCIYTMFPAIVFISLPCVRFRWQWRKKK